MAMVDAAMVICGCHPTRKYPEGYEGKIYLVGLNTDALSKVFYKKLLTKGEFRIIRDNVTHKWRSFDPNTDKDRADESRQAPPLIPRRMVKEESFRIKKTKVPKTTIIVNDLGQTWELDFYTSEAEPPRGVNLDAVYFSEEIDDPEWYNEMVARLVDRRGYMVWDAAQQDGCDALAELDSRADIEALKPKPNVWKIRLSLYDNPYIPVEEIEQLSASLLTEDDRRVRIYGEPAVKKIRLFPEWAANTGGRHHFKRDWLPNGNVPANWTRYMALDPGYETCAALFVAVPPPSWAFHPKLVLAYDEMYVWGKSIEEHAEYLANKMLGQAFYAFIIDDHQAAKHESTGTRIRDQYVAAFTKRNIRSQASDCGFWPGFDNVRSGVEIVRTALQPIHEGMPKFMVLADTCPNLVNEMRSLKRDKKRSKYKNIMWQDVPAPSQADHGFDCVRYVLAANPDWHAPKPGRSWADEMWKRFTKRRNAEPSSVVLGPRSRDSQEE